MNKELPLCACGCGLMVSKPGNKFIHGHNSKGVPRTPEHCAAIASAKKGVKRKPFTVEHCAAIGDARRGVPLPLEHCDAISKAMDGVPHTSAAQLAADEAKRGVPRSPEICDALSIINKNSDACKENSDSQIGGDDIVWHHTLYDHSDLSLNRVPMTRRNHAMGHRLLQTLGIEIEHINVNGGL